MPSAGTGRLWSFAAFHKEYLDDFHLPAPYVVAIVALDEGVRLYANIIDSTMTDLQVDSSVRSRFITDASGTTHLTFIQSDKEVP
ncbi:Zn-ribbon domain-containing OB-fold protein [Mycobacterium sp. NPDC003323]